MSPVRGLVDIGHLVEQVLANQSTFADRPIRRFGLSGGPGRRLVSKPLNLTPRFAASAVIGGLLMGFDARLSFGCNIGAFLARRLAALQDERALAARRLLFVFVLIGLVLIL